MKLAMLDTDILSYVFDERYPEVMAKARQYNRVFRYLTISSITVTEMLRGMRRVNNFEGEKKFLAFLDGCEVIPFDTEEADITAAILAKLERKGQKIGPLDPFIAATAIQADRLLITNNTKDYQRIIDLDFPLTIANWREM